jgi:spermidine/putrescine ABC transporter ATP-binding subunit
MARAVVELRGCTRDFGTVRAVDALDLAVHEGELLSLLGPSGCGKTTTLNLIAGFVAPSAGRVIVDGQDVTARPPHERGLGVVFQSYALFPHMSVFENVAFGLRERRVAKSEIERRVDETLALVRLQGQGERRPRQLSGGMQQRAALARALVYAPRVLLLDEPLAALDRKLREEMRAELREILREVGITTVFVTHDQTEALSLSDRIAVMNQGRIEQLGPPRAIYERPATRFVADFIGGSSRLRGRVTAPDRVDLGAGVSVVARLGRLLEVGEAVELGIRPERVAVAPSGAAAASTGGNQLVGRITRLTYLGAQTEVTVEIAGGQSLLGLVAEPSPAPLAVGGEVVLVLSPDAFLLL